MKEIFSKIAASILTSIYQPFWFSLLMAVLFMFFYLYSHEKPEQLARYFRGDEERGYKGALQVWGAYFRKDVTFRRLFYLAFFVSFVLFRTLLNRNMWMNPLSDVMGNWWIYKEDGELTTECIENLLLFIPFSPLLCWLEDTRGYWGKSRSGLQGSTYPAGRARNNRDQDIRVEEAADVPSLGSVLWLCVRTVFLFSLSIESLQLFLRLGTFQFSDLVYNTLGGAIGGVLYWTTRRLGAALTNR